MDLYNSYSSGVTVALQVRRQLVNLLIDILQKKKKKHILRSIALNVKQV